ncbi:MAG: YjbQ family protein [Alphaproteobacteria bacterium]|nr:MAG: YjbQ family protein [Alphaproteobacteria bacterium]
MLKQAQTEWVIATSGPGCHALDDRVKAWLSELGAGDGLVHLFCCHSSASLVIQENADPDVQRDLLDALDRLAPRDPRLYRHGTEGPDDMPAHIKTMLTQTHLAIPVRAGALLLGTWQGLYLLEHRDRGHRRRVVGHYLGEIA